MTIISLPKRRTALLPAGITLGDRVYVLTAGAYSNSMERYNGIEFPETVVVGLN